MLKDGQEAGAIARDVRKPDGPRVVIIDVLEALTILCLATQVMSYLSNIFMTLQVRERTMHSISLVEEGMIFLKQFECMDRSTFGTGEKRGILRIHS